MIDPRRVLGWVLVSGALALGWLAGPAPAAAEIRFSVEDIRGLAPTIAQWQPLMDYLTAEVGEKVTLIPLVTGKAVEVAARRQADFMMNNPVVTALVQASNHTTLVATVIMPWGPQFAGVIFTTPGTGIKTVEDMRGKTMVSHFFASAGGGHFFQRYHLHLKGFEVFRDFSSVKEVPRQDDIVLAIKSGVFDVGFCRTGMIEDLEKRGKVKMSDFVIIDKVDDPDFPFVRSTRLYPEWYVAAIPGTDPKTIEKVKAALLRLKPESTTAEIARIRGFQEPLSIDGTVEMLKALKIPPLDRD